LRGAVHVIQRVQQGGSAMKPTEMLAPMKM
jgi:hypothetical protein